MKSLFKLLTAIACFAGCVSFMHGQENGKSSEKIALTVEQAVSYALENSKSLQSSAIDLEIKKRASGYSWNTLLPSATLSGTLARSNNSDSVRSGVKTVIAAMSEKKETDVTDSMIDAAIKQEYGSEEAALWHPTASLKFTWNFNAAMIQSMVIAKRQYEAGKISWEKTCNETELSIRQLFYGILMMEESLKIDEESLANAEARWKQAEINYKNGQVPELSVLNSRVTYQNKKPNVEWARQNVSQQKDLFAFLLGLPYGQEIQLIGSIDEDFNVIEKKIGNLDASQLFEKYIEQNSDIQNLKKTIQITKSGLSASYLSTFSPTVSVGWGLNPLVTNITKDWTDKSNYTESGSLSITVLYNNLFDMLPFSANMQKIKDTKQNLSKIQLGLEQAYQNAEMTINNSIDDIKKSRDNIESMKRNIEVAQSAYRSTLRGYYNGSQEELAVRDSENSLNQAKLGLTSEKLTFITSVLKLENQLNTKLTK